jgi:hypothetical protein
MGILYTPRNLVRPVLDPVSVATWAGFIGDSMVDLQGIRASLVGMSAKLDADVLVNDTDYNSNDPAALTTVQTVCDGPRGLSSGGVLDTEWHALTATWLADMTAIRAALVAMTAKLDADTGVTDIDYNSEDPAALTVAADTFSDWETRNDVAPFGLTAADYVTIRTVSNQVRADIAAHIASIAAINAKLDLDTGVTDTDYAALWDVPTQQSAAMTAS